MNLQERRVNQSNHYYGWAAMPNRWINDNDRSYPDKFFDGKDYEDFYFDNFYDMDKMFGHENSLFGTRGLPVGHPDRSSKSFDLYNKLHGPMVVRVIKDNNLQEQISRIQSMMGVINESNLPNYIVRRLDLSRDENLKYFKEYVMRYYQIGDKEKSINNAFFENTHRLLNKIERDDYDCWEEEIVDKVKKHLESQFKEDVENLYDSIFSGNDDQEVYCFIKHNDLYPGLKTRGFSECVRGWYNFLSKYGYWFPDLDWNKIREKLDANKGKRQLIKKPLEGHIYHYYFSVLKK
jgi:hypothetical protein